MRTSIAGFGSAITMALALCGCQPDALSLRDVASPRLGIATMSRTYGIPTGSCSLARTAIQRFIETTADGRPESLRVLIETPRTVCARLVASAAEAAGVPRAHILVVTEPASKSMHEAGQIRVDRLVAVGADCYVPRTSNYISPNDNGFDPALGCSTLNNIGDMLADPEELHIGSGRVKAEGEPAARAVAAQERRENVPALPPGPPQEHLRTTAAP